MWQLASPPATLVREAASSASYSIETTTEIAQVSNTADKPTGTQTLFRRFSIPNCKGAPRNVTKGRRCYSRDRNAGRFPSFVAREKTDAELGAVCLSIPKRDYDEWIHQQKD